MLPQLLLNHQFSVLIDGEPQLSELILSATYDLVKKKINISIAQRETGNDIVSIAAICRESKTIYLTLLNNDGQETELLSFINSTAVSHKCKLEYNSLNDFGVNLGASAVTHNLVFKYEIFDSYHLPSADDLN